MIHKSMRRERQARMALVVNAGRMPKKRSANLTGDKFKTRKFTDYTGMKNETVILSPIKGLNGEIDFTDAETFSEGHNFFRSC